MIKTITAALVAASMLTAPALAAGTEAKTNPAPATKSAIVATKPVDAKVGNAKAQMMPEAKAPVVKKVRHHHARKHLRHHSSKAKIGSKVSDVKPVTKQAAKEMRS